MTMRDDLTGLLRELSAPEGLADGRQQRGLGMVAATTRHRPRWTVKFAVPWLGLGLPIAALGLLLSDYFPWIEWNLPLALAALAILLGPLLVVGWVEYRWQRAGRIGWISISETIRNPIRSMTQKQIVDAANTDPDNRPLSPADLRRMKRTPRVKIIRRAFGIGHRDLTTAIRDGKR